MRKRFKEIMWGFCNMAEEAKGVLIVTTEGKGRNCIPRE